ncbi:MAG: hypothetical protein G01um101438_430 [Parcubacteria group bacterium Gr01-1014_38]|nr:MAG: hypothetical protein G01um101438_430 [Parcubacteria group bacterium Gr01-1014_38]
MAFDVEEKIVGAFLKKTLWLWLFPYIFWFFGRRMYRFLYDWVTEPEPVPVEQGEQLPQT